MRIFNRISIFLAVSGALMLFGRINKFDLYHAYFRTIADVEVRNSQGIEKALNFSVANETQPDLALVSQSPAPLVFGILATRLVFKGGNLLTKASLSLADHFRNQFHHLTVSPGLAP